MKQISKFFLDHQKTGIFFLLSTFWFITPEPHKSSEEMNAVIILFGILTITSLCKDFFLPLARTFPKTRVFLAWFFGVLTVIVLGTGLYYSEKPSIIIAAIFVGGLLYFLTADDVRRGSRG
jgi:hypothetical protein